VNVFEMGILTAIQQVPIACHTGSIGAILQVALRFPTRGFSLKP